MPLMGMVVLIMVLMMAAMLRVMMMVVMVQVMILYRLLREGKRKLTKRDLLQRVGWSCTEARRQQLQRRLPLRCVQQGEAAGCASRAAQLLMMAKVACWKRQFDGLARGVELMRAEQRTVEIGGRWK